VDSNFEVLVEQVRTRSVEEKEQLKFLIERDLVEARRRDIAENHKRSEEEAKGGKLKFASSIDDLKKIIAHE
jgi:hypothetical protein